MPDEMTIPKSRDVGVISLIAIVVAALFSALAIIS